MSFDIWKVGFRWYTYPFVYRLPSEGEKTNDQIYKDGIIVDIILHPIYGDKRVKALSLKEIYKITQELNKNADNNRSQIHGTERENFSY